MRGGVGRWRIIERCHKARPEVVTDCGCKSISSGLWGLLSTLADSLWDMVWVSEPPCDGVDGGSVRETGEGDGEKAFCLEGHSPAFGRKDWPLECRLISATTCLLSALVQFTTCTTVLSSHQCNTSWACHFPSEQFSMHSKLCYP